MNFCFRRRIALLIYFGSPSWNTALTCSVSIWRASQPCRIVVDTESTWDIISWFAGRPNLHPLMRSCCISNHLYTVCKNHMKSASLVVDTVKHICQVCIHCRWVNSTPPLGKVLAFIWCFLLQTRYRFKIKRWYSLWLLLRSFNRSLVSTLLASKNRYISTLTGPPNSLDHYEASWDFDEIKVA